MTSPPESYDVLIVEDDPELLATLADLLSVDGLSVRTASDGAVALQALADTALPKVMVLDLMMPNLNGEQLREAQLRDARLASIPLIVLSAAHDAKARARAMNAAAYFPKPLRVDEFLGKLAEICHGGRRAGSRANFRPG